MSLKTYFLLVIALTLFACQTKKTPDEILTLDEVVSGSENTPLSQADTLIPTVQINEDLQEILTTSKLEFDSIIPIDTLLFIDRYEVKSNYKYFLTTKKTKSFVAHWEFENQALAKNAFMNWIQCYGAKCSALTINDSTSVSAEKMGIFLTENHIYYLNNITQKDYTKFLQTTLENQKIKVFIFAFYQNGKKGVIWLDEEYFSKND